jgi:PEGA domain
MKPFYKVGACLGLFATAIFMFNGCATLFKGSTETISYSSDPSEAKVYVNGQLMGTTPFQLQMKSNQTYTIEFRKDGYQDRTVLLNNSVGGGWIVLDVLGGLIPVIIDAATGDWYSLDQSNVNAALEAQQKSQ